MPRLVDTAQAAMRPHRLQPGPGRFLHLVHDEKYIDANRAIYEEAAPGGHDFLVVGAEAPLRYIRTFVPARLDLRSALRGDFLAQLPRYSAVFVHYLGDAARVIVAAAPSSTRFVWLGWGADYYHLLHSEDELLLPRTRQLVSRLAPAPQRSDGRHVELLQHASGVLRAAFHPFGALHRLRVRRSMRRVGHHAPGEIALINRFAGMSLMPEEFAMLRARHPGLRVPLMELRYWTEGFRTEGAHDLPAGNNVLLGNSASATNNHLDALHWLADILPADRKVICPLNYGDARYGDAVEEAGHRLLGERFVPLREYLDSGAYSEVLASCSIVVMNHLRQQAFGNIVLALCSGAHVFLPASNPIHSAMRRMGIDVQELTSLPGFFRDGEPPVAREVLQARRRRLDQHYGRAAVLRASSELLTRLAAAGGA